MVLKQLSDGVRDAIKKDQFLSRDGIATAFERAKQLLTSAARQ
jgi:hypothetical protein